MTVRPPPEWHVSNEPDADRTRGILAACRCGSQARFASLYASTPPDSLPPLSYCLYIATTVSRWPPLVSYILTLDATPPQNWPYSQRNNQSAARGLREDQLYEYVYYSILSPVSAGDISLVQVFLDAGLKYDTVLQYHRDRVDCLLERAVQSNRLDMVRHLLAQGANPRQELSEGEPFTVIALAARNNLPGALRLLTSDAARGRIQGSWALWHAAISSAFDAAETLLDLGADVNELFNSAPDEEEADSDQLGNGMGTALHCAVIERQLAFVDWLIRKGARLDIKNARGQTAGDIAMAKGYSEITEMLNTRGRHHSSGEMP